jgi:hypothetical protein
MVRDNWQTKAESVTARRMAAKQRKQQRESRGAYKHMVLDLFTMLDRHERGATSPPPVIHMWTDSPPSDSPPLLDTMEGKRKGRSGSIGTDRKGRSNSIHEEKKKAHPRSNKEVPAPETTDEDAPRLCRQHFCSGKCNDKKGGCRHVHVPGGQCKTLAQVVTDKDILSLSSAANEDDGDNTGGMDMIYYLSIDAVKDAAVFDGGVINISDLASKKLADETCGIASVVYLAMNNHLLFDRYRGGVIVSDSELENILQGDERRLRSTSVFSEDGNDNEDAKEDHDLPSHVLEYILRFLPDVAVASMSRVCSAWYNEIGQDSPDMWRNMLERRQWPMMPAEIRASESPRNIFRRSFLRHFSVVRDIEAVKLAAGAIMSTSRKIVEEKEMVYQVFSARRLAPQSQNPCIAVRVWSANHVLIAYSRDCTLRLFKAVDKTTDGASPRACRELVCVSVKPYKNTRKRYYRLVAMDLDDDAIACLFESKDVGQGIQAFKLTVTSREAFLCADGSGTNDPDGAALEEGALQVFDVGDTVLNYLLSCGEVGHRLLPLFDFLTDGGDLSSVDVLVSQNIHACGYGRFLLEVAISIPSPEWNEEGEDIIMSLERKIVLFSATAGAIIWMEDCNPTESLLPRHEDVTMASFRHHCRPGERRAACSFAFVSSFTDIILSAELDATGQMQNPTVVEASRLVRNELLENNWQIHRFHYRPVVITFSDVVLADTLFRELDGGRKVKKSVVSFYPRFGNDLSYATLTLEGDCEAIRMERIQDDYAVVLCRVRKFLNAEAAIDGDDAVSLSIEAIVIHVPSRRAIHRVCLLEEDSAFPMPGNDDIPILFAASGETVGVGLWWKGVILTGKDVREVGSNTMHAVEDEKSRGAKKQKKKQRQSTKGKKDGFARGMSLTG